MHHGHHGEPESSAIGQESSTGIETSRQINEQLVKDQGGRVLRSGSEIDNGLEICRIQEKP